MKQVSRSVQGCFVGGLFVVGDSVVGFLLVLTKGFIKNIVGREYIDTEIVFIHNSLMIGILVICGLYDE